MNNHDNDDARQGGFSSHMGNHATSQNSSNQQSQNKSQQMNNQQNDTTSESNGGHNSDNSQSQQSSMRDKLSSAGGSSGPGMALKAGKKASDGLKKAAQTHGAVEASEQTGQMQNQKDANLHANKGAKNGKPQSEDKAKKADMANEVKQKSSLGSSGASHSMFSVLLQVTKLLLTLQALQNAATAAQHVALTFMQHIAAFIGKIAHGLAAIGHGIAGAWHAATGMVGSALGVSSGTSNVIAVSALAAILGISGISGTTILFAPKDSSDLVAQCTNAEKSAEGGATVNIAGVSGAWTQKGTKAYNLAKQIYMAAKSLGMDDTHAAGVVGNAEAEGAANGSLEQPETDGSGLNGRGIYQFTGSTLSEYESWASKHGHNPWESAQVETEGIFAIKDPSGDYKKTHYDNPADAAKGAYGHIENSIQYFDQQGQQGQQRQQYAAKAYSMFNGIGGKGADAAAENDDIAAQNAATKCGGQGSSTVDGTGAVSEKTGPDGEVSWRPDNVPSDVKQYIQDPKKVGMGWGSNSGWANPDSDGQCVPFASSYFYKIWGITGACPMAPTGATTVDTWAKAIKGKVSSTPQAGAIASTTQRALTGGESAGHTYIVLHVLANGDAIIAEQNWTGENGSGADVKKPHTWNYALFSKSLMAQNTKFFVPDTNKYHLNWNNK